MLLHEICINEWNANQWNQPVEKLYFDFAEIRPSLEPEQIAKWTAKLERMETAVEHDNNELAADLFDEISRFVRTRLVAIKSVEDSCEEEHTDYQHQIEGDDPYYIEDQNPDTSANWD